MFKVVQSTNKIGFWMESHTDLLMDCMHFEEDLFVHLCVLDLRVKEA